MPGGARRTHAAALVSALGWDMEPSAYNWKFLLLSERCGHYGPPALPEHILGGRMPDPECTLNRISPKHEAAALPQFCPSFSSVTVITGKAPSITHYWWRL